MHVEFLKVSQAVAVGFLIMGFIGFFVKLVHIPINNIIVYRLYKGKLIIDWQMIDWLYYLCLFVYLGIEEKTDCQQGDQGKLHIHVDYYTG